MSEIKVNKISPRTNCGTVTLGDSGDTFTIPAGATITNNGTAAGFGATGAASWDTTVKTSGFTAVSGVGYFVDTTSGAISVNLPAGTAGDVVAIKDYANTFDTNAVTLVQNGSDKIGGSTVNATLSTEGLAVTLVFVDSTQGWLVTDNGTQDTAPTPQYVTATGGTIITSSCGNFKSHVFTGPGTFCVSCAGNATGSNLVDYFVVAGGGASRNIPSCGGSVGGGGGGGFRVSNSYSIPAPTMSPLSNPTALSVSIQGYGIVVGGGGTSPPSVPGGTQAPTGSVSTFSTITSAGGGGTGSTGIGGAGGSGGAGSQGPTSTSGYPGGAGNTPPVSPPQGNPGGAGYDGLGVTNNSGGGGGAGAAGGNASCGNGGIGGAGSFIADAFIGPTAPSYGTPGPVGSTRYFAGGGGGNTDGGGSAGGVGGGGRGFPGPASGTINTGGGTGAGSAGGGSGIVIIRYKFQN